MDDGFGKGLMVGLVIGIVVTMLWFMYNSTYNGALLNRGMAQYNSVTGELELKGCKNDRQD